MELNRTSMAHAIRERLDAENEQLLQQWRRSAPISHFVLDDEFQRTAGAAASGHALARRYLAENDDSKLLSQRHPGKTPVLQTRIPAMRRALITAVTGDDGCSRGMSV